MTGTLEAQFAQIADLASSTAAGIVCSPSEYREGLEIVIEQLQSDVAASLETRPDSE